MFNLVRADVANEKTVLRSLSRAAVPPEHLHTTITAELPLPSSFRVLVAEHDPIQGLLLLTFLDRLGVDAVLVEDGLQALSAVELGAFSMVLMNHAMPVLDGVQASAAIRERERASGRERITIVGGAAAPSQGETERCLAAGMDDLLLKPISVRDLCRVLLQHGGTEH